MPSHTGQKAEETKYLLGAIEKPKRYSDGGGGVCVEIGSHGDLRNTDVDVQADVPSEVTETNEPLNKVVKSSKSWSSQLLIILLLGAVVSLHTIATRETNVAQSNQNSTGSMRQNIVGLDMLQASFDDRYEHGTLSSCLKDKAQCRDELNNCQFFSKNYDEERDQLQQELGKCKSDHGTSTEKVESLNKTNEALKMKSDDLIVLLNAQRSASYKAFGAYHELKSAVDRYLSRDDSSSTVAQLYGYPINKWDVSQVENFAALFDARRNEKAAEFNEDLSEWDVSNGRYFTDMFYEASKFTSDLSAWKMSSAETTRCMFCYATSFDSDLSAWDLSNIPDNRWMFTGATSFHGPKPTLTNLFPNFPQT